MSAIKELSPQASSTASMEALDLLSCFYDGIEDLVYQTAETVARRRTEHLRAPGDPVEIEVEDVQKAGELVVAGIKKMVSAGSLPAEIAPSIEEMFGCVASKTR